MARLAHRRSVVGAPLILLAVLWALPAGVAAGGIAVIVDRPPSGVRAGEPFEVGFTVRSAHADATPVLDAMPLLRFEHAEGAAEPVTARAEAGSTAGHYVATTTLPAAGRWRWWIQPFGDDGAFRTTQPPLDVQAAEAATADTVMESTAVEDVEAHDRGGISGFTPRTISVPAGTTVRWQNTGSLPHTITAVDGNFASGALTPDARFEHRFERPGTYGYYCEYHGGPDGTGQYGTVVVTAATEQAPPVEKQRSIVNQVAALPAETPAPQQLPALGAESGVGLALLIALGAALVGAGLRRKAR